MSNKTDMTAPKAPREDTRGIKEIADTLRRHARLSNKQLRISLTVATVVIILLAAVIILAQSRAVDILKNNESAVLLKESMYAERIELTNKLALTEPSFPNVFGAGVPYPASPVPSRLPIRLFRQAAYCSG